MITTKANTMSGGLHRFLARRPRHAARFLPRFLREGEELLARRGQPRDAAGGDEPAHDHQHAQHERRLGEVVVRGDTADHARHRQKNL